MDSSKNESVFSAIRIIKSRNDFDGELISGCTFSIERNFGEAREEIWRTYGEFEEEGKML